MIYKKGCLCIIIKNPYVYTLKFGPEHALYITKANPKLHGIGLESMRSALSSSHGNLSINTNDNVFTIKLLLYTDS